MRYFASAESGQSRIHLHEYASKSLLLWLLIIQFCCTAPKKTPAFSSQAQEGYVEAGNGVRLFYRLIGSGSDTVVVIHGGPGFTMDYFLEDLAPLAANHALIFYDQRGTGRSTLVSDSISLDAQRFVDDLESVRKHFRLQRLIMLGHSWGTGLEALYAMKYPEHVNKLVVVGALPLQQFQLIEAFQQLETRRDSTTLRRMRELREARLADPGNAKACHDYYVLWFELFFGDRGAATPSKGDFCAGTFQSRQNKMKSVDRYTLASLGKWDWRSSLSKVLAPTLVIHGTKDPLPLAGAQAWATVLPNAQLLQLEGIGHFPYLEVPDRFFEEVEQFLRKK